MDPSQEKTYFHSFIPVSMFSNNSNNTYQENLEQNIRTKLLNQKILSFLTILNTIKKHDITFQVSTEGPGLVINRKLDKEIVAKLQENLSELFQEHVVVLSKK